MEDPISDYSNDQLESEKYSIRFYLGSTPPDELERAKQEALNDINNTNYEKRN